VILDGGGGYRFKYIQTYIRLIGHWEQWDIKTERETETESERERDEDAKQMPAISAGGARSIRPDIKLNCRTRPKSQQATNVTRLWLCCRCGSFSWRWPHWGKYVFIKNEVKMFSKRIGKEILKYFWKYFTILCILSIFYIQNIKEHIKSHQYQIRMIWLKWL